MKVQLIVVTAGKWQGKALPITRNEFVIGRAPECHLRPASTLISHKHTSVLINGNKVFLKDLESTNGTFFNGRQLKGEIELLQGDKFMVGPLEFSIQIEDAAPAAPPANAPVGTADDTEAAGLLLALEGSPPPGSPGVDEDGIPTGSTEMGITALPPEEEPSKETAASPPGKTAPAKSPAKPPGDTSSAAKSILDKYLRRPRSGGGPGGG